MLPPWAVMSPIRAAGRPTIRTVKLPRAMTSGGPTHRHISVTRAAGRAPDENGDGAGRQNRPAYVRNRRHARCDHRANVHVGDPRLRLPIPYPFVLFTTSTPLSTNPLNRGFNCSGSAVAASMTAAVTSFAVMK